MLAIFPSWNERMGYRETYEHPKVQFTVTSIVVKTEETQYNKQEKRNAYVKSTLWSIRTRESKAEAKETAEGSWVKRITVIWEDKASQDRIARLCLALAEPAKGTGAEKIVILGFLTWLKPLWLKLDVLWISSLNGGSLWVVYKEKQISTNP